MEVPEEGCKRCKDHGATGGPKGRWGNELERRFVEEFIIDLDGEEAVKRAGFTRGDKKRKAKTLLGKPHIRQAIEDAIRERSKRLEISADEVLRRWWAIATADPNELTQLRRGACRYCWGEGNLFQRTPEELRKAQTEYERRALKAEEALPPFDAQGGSGYNPKRQPNPDCPECFGDGVPEVFFGDTRGLSEEGRLLFAGVKKTRDGLEVKMHSAEAALEKVAKHLGMLTDHVDVTTAGEKVEGGVVFYLPSNGRDQTAEGTAGSVPEHAG